MNSWIWNPKTKGSGIITCIPQMGRCPYECPDCFFQSGRSYLEPLEENLPHIPRMEMAKGRVVRMNDGNDSNVQRDWVEYVAGHYTDCFFNTSRIDRLEQYPGPVVLTINPGVATNLAFYRIHTIPTNLMFVRVRTNTWNLDLVRQAVQHYAARQTHVVLTFMAYYENSIPPDHTRSYAWQRRTTNSYWAILPKAWADVMARYEHISFVHSCGTATVHACRHCGNCIREYYATKERMRGRRSSCTGCEYQGQCKDDPQKPDYCPQRGC